MKTFWRILSYSRAYAGKLILHIVTTIIGVSLLGISISFLDSVFKLLFSDTGNSSLVNKLQNSPFAFLSRINEFLIDIINRESKVKALAISILIVVGLYLLSNLFRYVAQLLMNSIRTRIIQRIRSDMFDKANRLKISSIEGERKGDIITRFTADMVNIEQSILATFESLIRDPYTIIYFVYLMIMASPSLTLYIFLLIPPMAILVSIIGRSLKKNSVISQERLSMISTVIDEFSSGIRIIKAFNAGKYISSVFNHYNNGYRKQSKKVLNKHRAIPLISESLGIITVGIFLYFSGKLVFTGQLQSSLIMVFVIYFQQITQPAKKLSQAYGNIMKGAASADRVFEVMDSTEVMPEKQNAIEINDFKDKISFKNVHFAYTSTPVLDDISFDLPKGKIYALVGQSGSGKTTLAELILRFYDIDEGQISIDNMDIRDLKIQSLRQLMAVVTQEPILFNDTIYNNICFGMNQVSPEKVEEAARAANAHDFIMETDKGYQTKIGDRGALLSGGQRQRLSIARALLKNPQILILDEATSALDTASEKLVQDALSKLMQNRTSLVIAHRLSTIQNADQILVIDKGRIIESGTHQELIARNGTYQHLFELQQLAS